MEITAVVLIFVATVAGVLVLQVLKLRDDVNLKSYQSIHVGQHMVGIAIADDSYENSVHMLTLDGFWDDFSGEGWRKRFFVRRYFRLPICKRGSESLTVFYAFSHQPRDEPATP